MRERYAYLMAHPEEVEAMLQRGAEKARALAVPMLRELRHAVGLRTLSAQATSQKAPVAAKAALPAFKQYRESDGQFYFKLTDASGRVLLQSTAFESPRDAGQIVKRLQQEGEAALPTLTAHLAPIDALVDADLRLALQQLVESQST